jgi:predicted ribosome quality control (RQC) complex YloA/Tae2 family protein
MKAFILKKIANFLKEHKKIKKAFRVDENIIFMQFDNDKVFFDLTKSKSNIYININYPSVRRFKAPFDLMLQKKFTNSNIVDVVAIERTLTIIAKQQFSFKEEIVKLRLEFTGRYTNAIILDKDDTILEALRHISENQSIRVIKPSLKLPPLPKKEINEKEFEIKNLISFTQEEFKKRYSKELENRKKNLISNIDKKIKKIEDKLNSLEKEEDLLKKAENYQKIGDVVVANLHKIKPYQKELKTYDFEGNEITIPIPELSNINQIGTYYYNLAKKNRQKAKNLHIQKEHLLSSLNFLKNHKKLIQNTTNIADLKIFTPTKKEKKEENYEKFIYDDYTILVGKNEKGNIELLKKANANDLWLHIKNYPGAHVIIKNNKLSLNDDIIKKAAKLAVAFSGRDEGEVDYTKRKFVKIKQKANVEYGKYNTIKVRV